MAEVVVSGSTGADPGYSHGTASGCKGALLLGSPEDHKMVILG